MCTFIEFQRLCLPILCLCCYCALTASSKASDCLANTGEWTDTCFEPEDMKADESGSIDEVSAMQTTLVTNSQEQMGWTLQASRHGDANTLKSAHNRSALPKGITSASANTPELSKHVNAIATSQNTEALTEHAAEPTKHANTIAASQQPDAPTEHTVAKKSSKLDTTLHTEHTPDERAPKSGSTQTKQKAKNDGFTFWDIDFKITLAELSVLLLIVISRELGLARNWFGKQEFRPDHRCYMKIAEILRIVVAAADYAFLIPLSLNVATVLGGRVVVSGFLISSFALGVGLGTILSMRWLAFWSHLARRRYLVLSLTVTSVCECALSVLMTVPGVGRSGFVTLVLIIVRVIAGICAGCGTCHILMLGSVCTSQELNKFEQWAPIADFIGYIFGLLSVVVASAFGYRSIPKDYFEACGGPMLSIACFHMITASLISYTLPLELEQVSFRNDDRTEDRDIVEYEPDILAADAEDVISTKSREDIAVNGFVTVGLVALSTIGMEAGTSYMMEVEYHWQANDIALGMAAVFAFITFSIAVTSMCRVNFGTSVDRRLIIPLLILSICASVLYFPHPFSFAENYHLFIGDAFIYGAITLLGGMMMGYAVWASNPEKWNYRENLVGTVQVVDAAVKLFGAPAVRVLIQFAGRQAYAIMQMILISMLLLAFIWVKNVDMYCDKSTMEDAVPSGRGFFQEVKHRRERFMKNFRPDD